MDISREPNDFTIMELKEKLKTLKLSLAGNKSELISRLIEADPSGNWMRDINETNTAFSSIATDQRDSTPEIDIPDTAIFSRNADRREMELLRREKELMERELKITRAELQSLQDMRRLNISEQEQRANQDSVIVSSKLNITTIADLLGYFSGDTGDYRNWEQQLMLLRREYELTEGRTKILISMRLKGKALEWFHSDPTNIVSTVEDLLSGLREMFDHRPSKIESRRIFEQRIWQRGETFHEYVHAKTILANRTSMDKDEMLDYIIDGIPVASLRDHARIAGFTSKASLLRAFEKINLKERFPANTRRMESSTNEKQSFNSGWREDSSKDFSRKAERADTKEVLRNERRCYNCGQRNHSSMDCPTKSEGPKCFSCGERGHFAF